MSVKSRRQFLRKIGSLPLGTLYVFAVKQAWAALFGGLMLVAVIVTHYVQLPGLARYDWLFVFALLIQGFMLMTKLEKPHEVITIFTFHLVGLGMELFKTSHAIGSWSYPEQSIIHLGNVPLFSGFMYAAVGSYIARVWRIFNLKFSNYPRRRYTVLLAVAIYINFFTHHFVYDFRYVLFAVFAFLYCRVWVRYSVNRRTHHMPLLVAALLVAFFIWLAENISTFTHVWLYPSQLDGWHFVSLNKLGSWLLLMIISFVMVDLLHYFRAHVVQKKITDVAV